MGIAENLVEGFASAAGATDAVKRIEDKKQRRQSLSDQELQAQTQQILGDVSNLQDRRSKLDPNSPTYQQDLKTIDQALHDARGVFTDLYHPQNNPGALGKLTGYIERHLGKNKGQAASTPAQAKESISDRIGAIESAAYSPQAPQNRFKELRRQLKEAMPNLTDEQLDQAVMVNAGAEAKPRAATPSWKMYISPDGKQRDYFDVNDKSKVPPGWMPVSPRAQNNAPKVGSFGDFLIQAYGPQPNAEQYEEGKRLWAQSGAGTTVGEHIIMVPQKDGSIVPVTVQTTSTKSFAAPTSPNAPKTPAEAKGRFNPPPHAGIIAKGETAGGRLTAPQSAAQKKFDEASGLAKLADEIAQKPNDAINQKRLAVRLERLSAGRFTTQALDYIIKAGWGNTIQQWANNATTGALPPDVMRQLVDGAHQELDEATQELKSSGLNAPDTSNDADVDAIIKALKPQKKQ